MPQESASHSVCIEFRPMPITVRRCTAKEIPVFVATLQDAFGGFFSEAPERRQRLLQGALLHAAFDGAEMVGTAGAFDFSVTIPGGEVKAAGVTAVGVLPTHRRQGALTSLMKAQLEDLHSYNRPLAMLFASEGAIYPRFGYGLASIQLEINAERTPLRWLKAPPEARYRLVDQEAALELFPPIYEQARRRRSGMPDRTADWWELHRLHDTQRERASSGAMWRVLVTQDGVDSAYAVYRVKLDWHDGVPAGRVDVVEAVAASPAGEEAVWRYLFGIDLIKEVHTYFQPADSILLLLLAEPARLHAVVHDALWARVVDVPGALSARSYAAAGRLVLEISDELCPWNQDRWIVDSDRETASIAATEEPPDLRMQVDALGSAYFGGFTFAALVAAGRVEELRPGAIRLADAMFRVDQAPWCPEIF